MSYPLASAPTAGTAEVGGQLGQALAGLVLANMHAMEDGWDHGYRAEGYLSTCCPLPEHLAYIPHQYATVPAIADSYQTSFTQGRVAYHADFPTAPALVD
jgi:hypothetical protein